MDQPITDPTLAAFHEPKTGPECIYFAAYLTETGEARMTLVVRPATTDPASLKVEPIKEPGKDTERHAA